MNIKRQNKQRFIVQTQEIESNFHQQALISKLTTTIQNKLKLKGKVFYHVFIQPGDEHIFQDNWTQHALRGLDSSPFDFVFFIHKEPYSYSQEKPHAKGSKTIFIDVFPFHIPDQLSA